MLHLGESVIVLRGGGDIATGIALRLYRSGFRRLVIFETPYPLAVRRRVAFSEAVYEGYATVEGVTSALISSIAEIPFLWDSGCIPMLIDPKGIHVNRLRPDVVIEATLAKRNIGVQCSDAPLVIGIGPGFTAGVDVHRVVESCRGEYLGRVIVSGNAIPNTGQPASVDGYTLERVLRSPRSGLFLTGYDIGDSVQAGDVVALVRRSSAKEEIRAAISGTLRGLLRTGTPVTQHLKVGDIEPRDNIACHLVSDKALAIGGGVLEAILERFNRESSLRRGVLQR